MQVTVVMCRISSRVFLNLVLDGAEWIEMGNKFVWVSNPRPGTSERALNRLTATFILINWAVVQYRDESTENVILDVSLVVSHFAFNGIDNDGRMDGMKWHAIVESSSSSR